MELHPKIKELQLRASPVSYSDTSVDAKGEIVEDRKIRGYLAVWGVKDSYGTIFVRGCFAKSIREKGPDSDSKYKIKFLNQHKQDDPLSNFEVLKEDSYGLYFEASPDDIPSGNRVVTQVRSGTLNQFSIGFQYIWDKVEYNDATDALLLKEVDLYEGSVVTIPSNLETYALRSPAEYEQAALELKEETEDFIKSIPRSQQLQLRQLLTRNISLAKIEPNELRSHSLDKDKPNEAPVIDYKYLMQNLKNN